MPDLSAPWQLRITGAAPTDRWLTVRRAWDSTDLAQVEVADPAAVEKALTNAHALFRNRAAWLPATLRTSVLEKAAGRLADQAEDFARLIAEEGGKPLVDARVEVLRAVDGLRNCAELLRSDASVPAMNINAASADRTALVLQEPIGVVAAVSAFNHPLNLVVHQIGPAIAAGCPVIVKPAEDTPLSCYALVELLEEAGLPPGWCQPLVVGEISVAEQLVTDSRVGFFSFIGSARVGWMLRAKLAPGTRCALEHGGAAPVIVAADAAMERLVPAMIRGGFYHAGQVCVSVQRIFVEQSVVRKVTGQLADAAQALVTGDPLDEASEVGPLIRPAEVQRIAGWVDEARDCVRCGGQALSETCYAPTVLFNPPAGARVSREEIFGPVVCVYPVPSIDEALQRANELPFAFQASVFTQDIDRAMSTAASLDASTVMINDHSAFRVDWMPFAGLRESGLGTGGIPYSYRDLCLDKLVVMHTAGLHQ